MKKTFLPVLSLALIVSACFKPEPFTDKADEAKNTVRITVRADKEIGGEDSDTKVTYDAFNNKFGFENDDKLQLIACIYDSANKKITKQTLFLLDMDPENPGTFSGTITLGDYSVSDIRGAFLVKSALTTINYYMNGTTLTMRQAVANNQTQSAGDVFTSGNGRGIFYTNISSDQVLQNEGKITINDLHLKLGNAIWEFHVYGEDRTDEKITSISIESASTVSAAANYTACTMFYRADNGNYNTFGGDKYYKNTVALTTPVEIGSVSSSSQAIWMGLYGTDTDLKLGRVIVTTEKAVYTREFGGAEMERKRNGIYPININIGSSGSFTKTDVEYSVDGGTSWTTWTGELPDDVTTYTSLSLRPSDAAIRASDLTIIKDWIDKQSNPVSLDLSNIRYISTTFPDTFKGTSNGGTENKNGITVKAAGTKIKSIKFPSNVTAIAESAFDSCTALEAVDLTGIKTIGKNAFCNTALVTLDVPASVTSIGNLAFAYCWDLTDVTYHPKTEVNTANCFIFGCRNNKVSYANCPDKYKNNLIPLTFRFAKGARVLKYMFDTNHKLQTLIFEGDPNENGVGADAWLIRCRFLKTIDCSALTKVMAFTESNASGIGEQIENGTGSIILPTGLATTGWGLWNTLDSGAKYSITSAE